MDKPANPATPFAEVYQAFLDDLALEGRKPSTIHRYRYNIERFEKWLIETGRPVTLVSLQRTVLIADRQHLETLPQQPRGSHRRRRGGLLSTHTVHSYLRSIKCLASWLLGAGHVASNQFKAVNPYYKQKGVMPVLVADDWIPKIWKPSDVAKLLAGCQGERPEDLRDRALVELLRSGPTRSRAVGGQPTSRRARRAPIRIELRSRNPHSESEQSIGERNQGDPPLRLHGNDSIAGLAGAPSDGSEERGAAVRHDA